MKDKDWEEKLVDATRTLIESKDGEPKQLRRAELTLWLTERKLQRVVDIGSPQHVVELMELLDRWHDEDVAADQTAAPPSNPFIEQEVRQVIRVETFEYFDIKGFNHQFVNLKLVDGVYYPENLRALAKQLTDLADAHEEIYPTAAATDKGVAQ